MMNRLILADKKRKKEGGCKGRNLEFKSLSATKSSKKGRREVHKKEFGWLSNMTNGGAQGADSCKTEKTKLMGVVGELGGDGFVLPGEKNHKDRTQITRPLVVDWGGGRSASAPAEEAPYGKRESARGNARHRTRGGGCWWGQLKGEAR